MFKVKLINLKEELYAGLAQEVILPTPEGQLTILDFHQPLVSRLSPGVVCIDKRRVFKIKDGIANMTGVELLAVVQT